MTGRPQQLNRFSTCEPVNPVDRPGTACRSTHLTDQPPWQNRFSTCKPVNSVDWPGSAINQSWVIRRRLASAQRSPEDDLRLTGCEDDLPKHGRRLTAVRKTTFKGQRKTTSPGHAKTTHKVKQRRPSRSYEDDLQGQTKTTFQVKDDLTGQTKTTFMARQRRLTWPNEDELHCQAKTTLAPNEDNLRG